MQGWFIEPSGRRSLLVAGNAREFQVLVHRKLKAGWSLAPDSPFVPAQSEPDEFVVGIPAPPPPAASRAVTFTAEPPSPDERASAQAAAFDTSTEE